MYNYYVILIMCLLCIFYEYNYLFLSHQNLICVYYISVIWVVLMSVLYLCDSISRQNGCPWDLQH